MLSQEIVCVIFKCTEQDTAQCQVKLFLHFTVKNKLESIMSMEVTKPDQNPDIIS